MTALYNRRFRRRAIQLANQRGINAAVRELGIKEELLSAWIEESQVTGQKRTPSEQSIDKKSPTKLREFLHRRLRKLTSFGFVAGFVAGVLSSLAANWINNWFEARRTVPEVACLILQEIQINRSISERKHTRITEIAFDWRLQHNRDDLAALQNLKYEQFSTDTFDNRKVDLKYFSNQTRLYVEGLYGVMHYVNRNEPPLIDTTLRENGKEEYNLRAMLEPYVNLENKLFGVTEQPLKGLCYKSP
jgi:hypothetical protein